MWGAVWVLAGCAAAPIQQMSDARQSLQAARTAGAAVRAPALMKEAESNLSDAELSLTRRDYGPARKSAVRAKQEAATARRLAVAVGDADQAADRADTLGLLDDATTSSLRQIENQASSVDHAEALVKRARGLTEELNRRINRYYMDKAKPLIEQARNRRGTMGKTQRHRLQEVEQAYRDGHGKTAYDGVSILLRSLDGSDPGAGTDDAPTNQGRPRIPARAKPSPEPTSDRIPLSDGPYPAPAAPAPSSNGRGTPA